MSYALARPVLVDIVEAVTPTTAALGTDGKFRHDPRGDDAQAVGGRRRFWFRAVNALRRGPFRRTANELVYDIELVIEYQAVTDTAKLDDVIVADFEAVTAALANDANWQRPASTIRNVGAVDANVLFGAVVEDIDGGRRLRVSFPLEVTA
jgi:hypothetical protein